MVPAAAQLSEQLSQAMQSRAVIETARDVQRIRGLAGSGKTVVLALKAAYLHAQHPEWRIGVTFNTRSLSAQFEHSIGITEDGHEIFTKSPKGLDRPPY